MDSLIEFLIQQDVVTAAVLLVALKWGAKWVSEERRLEREARTGDASRVESAVSELARAVQQMRV